MTCRILSLLDRPQSALQANARMQSASTSGVFTINKDKRTLMPLLARTQPHILLKISSLLLNAGLDFVWNLATAPLNYKRKVRVSLELNQRPREKQKQGVYAATTATTTDENKQRDEPIITDLFSLYILFTHFRPCDALMGICLLFFSLVMRTFARA